MNVDTSYVHALEGRLRIKIPVVKGAAGQAQRVESHLRQSAGVQYVSANPITGNVLILYNPGLIDQRQIISSLKEAGFLSQSTATNNPASAPQGVVEKLTATVAATLMEVALSRLVGGLI